MKSEGARVSYIPGAGRASHTCVSTASTRSLSRPHAAPRWLPLIPHSPPPSPPPPFLPPAPVVLLLLASIIRQRPPPRNRTRVTKRSKHSSEE